MRRLLKRRRLVLTLVALLLGCGSNASDKPIPTPVRVATVEAATDMAGLRYSASIQPLAQVSLSFEAQARVTELRLVEEPNEPLREVQQGDFVAGGAILGRLDDREYREKAAQAASQLATANAALAAASLDFKRSSILFETQSVTAPEYDQARKQYESSLAQVQGAVSQLEQAKLALDDCTLRAPWDGVVLKRNVEIGQLVSPTVDAFDMADISSVKAVFGVPDLALSEVRLGNPIALQTDSFPNRQFKGHVSAISPAADEKSRVFEVQVTIPNPDHALKIGMIGSLILEQPAKALPMVPLSAIVRDPGDPDAYAVYVVKQENDTFFPKVRRVEIGQVRGDRISVPSGVTPGEQVIVNGATRVVSGHPIRIIR